MELYSQARNQEEEILFLREQISVAALKEMQLLNEKCTLERKFSELRMAIDEKQNEANIAASNELARRKGDLEENLKLAHELKAAEDERYMFMSSMLGLLAEYGIWPRVVNASVISNNIKHLHDQLQWKIRNSHDRMRELSTMVENHGDIGAHNNNSPGSGHLVHQIPNVSTIQDDFYKDKRLSDEQHLEPMNAMARYVQYDVLKDSRNIVLNGDLNQLVNNDSAQEFFNTDREAISSVPDGSFHNGGVEAKSRAKNYINGTISQYSTTNYETGSSVFEDGPGIENFQITGDAMPGSRLLGCGYPVRGTSLCMFQWVRHLQDGTRQYIEGATNPEYIVTADDVDKLIAVECIPMDDKGRQGELVRLFANDQNKITCDPEMQMEINTYISKGQAAFNVLLLMDSSDDWEPTTLFLRRSGYQIKINSTEAVLITGKIFEGVIDKSSMWAFYTVCVDMC
ncbi:Tripartite motif-containing 29 [Quillaja saponaria]|uniref:Tripartite motif-containing 29 n=1 Tax=Quillaja saponaria TaxID=32244 RepID=A0AAD7M3L8_QUISA|nr:Tripartite motif-containing 29 [Quillaja saponaria]